VAELASVGRPPLLSSTAAPRAKPAPRPQDLTRARALVIEPNATARSIMCAQLRDMGMADVRSSSRATDARLVLEREQFDVVLCSRDFDDPDTTGQDLVDELRREQLLPHSTVFIMVATQATYAQVTEAGEASLDGVLLRPYTAAALSERIVEARRRKLELVDLMNALAAGQNERAIDLCLARYHRGDSYANYAARVATELMLRGGEMLALQELCENVRDKSNAPWARLALVRAQLQRGDVGGARKACELLVNEEPTYADALDTLGRIHLEVGDVGRALAAYRGAVELTPGCLLRAQACGTLAFYARESRLATVMLDRCVSLGIRSRLFDALTLLILTVLRFDERNSRGLSSAQEQMRRYAERFAQSLRLATFDRAAAVLAHLSRNELDAAQAGARELALAVEADDASLETGIVALVIWSRLPPRDVSAGELEQLVRSIGNRFCVSKSMTELLVAAGESNAQIRTTIKTCQQDIGDFLETAMNHALEGRPRDAVVALLERGKLTRNAKQLETAMAVARRHAAHIEDADALIADAAATMARACQPVTLVAGIRRTGRSAGGLVLRT